MNEFTELREKAGLSPSEAAVRLGRSLSSIYRWERGTTPAPKMALESMQAAVDLAQRPADDCEPFFEFIDLFAGIGGLRKGFEPAGGKCVFTCEWDKYSRTTYNANFDCDHVIAGDIRQLDLVRDIPTHDVLLAGFPCQPFSIAGVSKKNSLGRPHGFSCESQGTLFFEVASIIEAHRPKAIMLENVKNLLSHDNGNTFRVIRETLDELGYGITYRVINSKGWVPQQRQRIFIVGFRRDFGMTEFDINDMPVPDPATGPKMGSILHSPGEIPDPMYTKPNSHLPLDKYTLSEKLWDYLQGYAAKHAEKGNGFGFGLVGPSDTARTLSARYYKDGSEILVKQRGKKRPRRLTPRECARLMGFDTPGKKEFEIPVSDTQAYKQFGNAVVVPVIQAIAEHMKPALQDLVLKHGKESEKPRADDRQYEIELIPQELPQPVVAYA